MTIRDENGRHILSTNFGPQLVPAGGSVVLSLETTLSQPRLWDMDHPALYRATIYNPMINNSQSDSETVTFGIREFHFDPATGFWLNGRNFKLNGVCLHGDGSCFGAAVPLSVWERRLRALRELGANAIRTAHNPPAPEFLDLCDRLGFLVMDEFFDCWTAGKNSYDYHLYFTNWSKIDARDTIRRDRNHPSIILYSVGNEIHDTPKAALAKRILAGLVEVCHENDPTRPVTQALFRPNVSGDYTNGLADLLDVIGTNYRDNELIAAHRAKPSRKIIGTEQGQTKATWLECRDHPEEAGQFLWTGVDYLGESRRWPRRSRRVPACWTVAHGPARWPSNGNHGGRTSRWFSPRAAPARNEWNPPTLVSRRWIGVKPYLPIGRRAISRPTRKPSRSIATAAKWICFSTAIRLAPARCRRTLRRAFGRFPSSQGRWRPLGKTMGPSPRATPCAPPGRPLKSC